MQPDNQSSFTEDSSDNMAEFNSQEAIESVYSADTIDIVDCSNAVAIVVDTDTSAVAANENFTEADIYSLDCARMAKHDRALERRSSKSQLTDRRMSARVNADGEAQPDRRAANRAANINAIRQTEEASES